MAVSTAQVGNLSITTQVVPAGENNIPGPSGLTSAPTWTQTLSQTKKQPIKSLSAVIILIGALQLCFGVSMYLSESEYLSLVSRSGAPCWGGLAFITTGIITVVLASEESIVKIQTCLISHVVNAAFAALGMVLYAVQVYTDSQTCWADVDGHYNTCIPGNSSDHDPYDYLYRYYWPSGDLIYALRLSVNSLILFYVIVGFIISICIALLRWKLLKKAKYTLLGN
ncbi:uncharacterized protein LOC130295496 [Hyla sarda]|uniref:uncharacterized protein LOC130295496 n=1 Tax=Hyla sarda TaxID=327740 RepID=UPI0024C3A522|nr:uncharacterized protein LOC130295496 [Hyla sarda]